jgi:hypothetical protein
VDDYGYQRNSVNGSLYTFLFGPRLNLRKFDYFVPFVPNS